MSKSSLDISKNSQRYSAQTVKRDQYGQPEKLSGQEKMEGMRTSCYNCVLFFFLLLAFNEGGLPVQQTLQNQAAWQLAGNVGGLSRQYSGDSLCHGKQSPDWPT